jgi:N-acetylmuramoyl-L-alanine amidase
MLLKEKIKFIAVHCSDTPNNDLVTAKDIHKMHLSFGWDGIGYHKIINRDGKIENGRPEYWVGAHVKGLNEESLGVCLIGKNDFTKKQLDSLKIVLSEWKKRFPKAYIDGHRNLTLTKKTCPNFEVRDWLDKQNL